MKKLALLLAAMGCLMTWSCSSDEDLTGSSSVTQLVSVDIKVGTGAEAVVGKTLSMHYSGWLYDASKADNKGLLFDSSVGRSPYSFKLGAGQVIAGWDFGCVGMKVGGQRRLTIPSSLAYGASGAGSVIPPNAALLFEVELVDVK
ncbi:MAG: FKBP-type peptidyl-prolyl cis-trans isomerase [Vicinamibacteria bacterium]|nr:FKBP-type peptidyl-prolyl cis-trans isomerase [Vicinamibacteria bacterium]